MGFKTNSMNRSPLRQLVGAMGFGICALLSSGTVLAEGPLRLNEASVDELARVDGVDEALAMRIVELRDDRGGISSVEALRVLDIDSQTLGNASPRVIFHADPARRRYFGFCNGPAGPVLVDAIYKL